MSYLNKKMTDKSGITLIELVVASVISGILFMIMFSLYSSTIKNYNYIDEYTEKSVVMSYIDSNLNKFVDEINKSNLTWNVSDDNKDVSTDSISFYNKYLNNINERTQSDMIVNVIFNKMNDRLLKVEVSIDDYQYEIYKYIIER